MITPRRVVLTLLLLAWLGLGLYAGRHLAGGLFLLMHKTNPALVLPDTWQTYWRDYQNHPTEKKRLQIAAGIPAALFLGLPLVPAWRCALGNSWRGTVRWLTRR
jgi:hypothetical protein